MTRSHRSPRATKRARLSLVRRYVMSEVNVKAVVNITGEEGFEAHRGVIPVRDDTFVVFGNDGYQKDERARREVATVRERLAGDAVELGFATDEDGYSWAMVVRFLSGCST